jgi:hypothetical protein
MTSKNVKKKQNSALGKGLDALIRSDYLDEKGVEEESKEIEIDSTKSISKSDDSQKMQNDDTEVNLVQNLNLDERIIEEVLLEVHKNPRISLWSAKSAAVLRFLKKTKPEFSISNEASILIDEAVKESHPDIWRIFEERGL